MKEFNVIGGMFKPGSAKDTEVSLLKKWERVKNRQGLPYIFGYIRGFSFQNNPKNLDRSYKTDLDLWNCLKRVKLV